MKEEMHRAPRLRRLIQPLAVNPQEVQTEAVLEAQAQAPRLRRQTPLVQAHLQMLPAVQAVQMEDKAQDHRLR